MEWKNRIIGHGSKPASKFQAHPNNWRKHPARQRKAVKGSLDDLGWIDTVIENVRTGRLIDGHERVWQALDNGDAEVPYIQVDLSESEEAQALLSLDATAALAESDAEKIDALLREVKTDNADVMEFLEDMAKDNGLYQDEQKDAEPQIDKAAELNKKWQVQTGDLWQIGEHKLLCGDSRKVEDIKLLIENNKIDLVLTDPPYGINVVRNNKVGGGGAYGGKKNETHGTSVSNNIIKANIYAKVIGDDTTETARLFYNACMNMKFKNIILWGGNYFTDFLPPSRGWICWDKIDGVEGTTKNFSDIELAWTSYDVPARIIRHRWQGLLKASEKNEKRCHPTQKPASLASECFKIYDSGKNILDGFGGSGFTVVACQNTGRTCFLVEMSEDYCAVILERMQATFPELEIKKLDSVNT
jgi:DNA modification methylase